MASGPMAKQYCGVKYQDISQSVDISSQAAVGYYSTTGITLNVPNGYTPVAVQWLEDWANMIFPVIRVNDDLYRLYFMCSISRTSVNVRIRVIYAQKD